MKTGEATDAFTAKVGEAVDEIRSNKKWRAEYMHTLVHEQDIRNEGEAIGREEGREEGKTKTVEITVRRMLLKNYPDNEIIDITQCNQEMIDKIKSEI